MSRIGIRDFQDLWIPARFGSTGSTATINWSGFAHEVAFIRHRPTASLSLSLLASSPSSALPVRASRPATKADIRHTSFAGLFVVYNAAGRRCSVQASKLSMACGGSELVWLIARRSQPLARLKLRERGEVGTPSPGTFGTCPSSSARCGMRCVVVAQAEESVEVV